MLFRKIWKYSLIMNNFQKQVNEYDLLGIKYQI